MLWGRCRSGKFNLAFLSAFAFDQGQSNFAANKMGHGGGKLRSAVSHPFPTKKKTENGRKTTDYSCRLIRNSEPVTAVAPKSARVLFP